LEINILKKLPHENEDQYIWRIGGLKASGIIEQTWEEISDDINKELRGDEEPWFDVSVYRKRYRDFERSYRNIFSKLEGKQHCEDLDVKIRELEKEKKKIQTEKLEYNRWLREEARDELIMEKICEALKDVDKLPAPAPLYSYGDDNDKSWVLAFGDTHFGSEFCIKGLCGEIINEYSPEIFCERMDDLLAQTIRLINKENIDELYVFDLGDQLDGILRVGQLMKLRFGVIDATLKYAYWLSGWLNELSKHCRIKYRQTDGNHTELRMLGAKKGSFEEDNLGKIIYEFVKVRLENNPNIDIQKNESGMIFESIQGFNVLGYHGESKNLENTMKGFSKMYGIPIDILIAGHLHHTFNETVGFNSDVMRTPSIIGVDDFSMKLQKTSNPGATLFCIEEGKGKVLDYHIKL